MLKYYFLWVDTESITITSQNQNVTIVSDSVQNETLLTGGQTLGMTTAVLTAASRNRKFFKSIFVIFLDVLSLPGFLLMSKEDYKIEETVIGTGGMGKVRKGVLLNPQLVKQHDFKDLAIKFYDCNGTLIFINDKC